MTIRSEVTLEPTGRPAKSTTSISEKLLRETIRLTQVQDIAGCRLIVADIVEQERVVQRLGKLFDTVTIVDRRKQPSHGYRAVHVIVKRAEKLVENQVRTALQHAWAEMSEKFSDVIDPALKYGKGDEATVKILLESSAVFAQEEAQETDLARLERGVSVKLLQGNLEQDKEQELVDLRREINELQKEQVTLREKTVMNLRRMIDEAPRRGGK